MSTEQNEEQQPTSRTSKVLDVIGDWLTPVIVLSGLAFLITFTTWTMLNSWTIVQRSDGKYSFRNGQAKVMRYSVFDTCEDANLAMEAFKKWTKSPQSKPEPDTFSYKKVRCE